MEIDKQLSRLFLVPLQQFCEQRNLRLLSKEEVDSGNLRRLNIICVTYPQYEPIGGVVSSTDIIDGFIQSFHMTPLPLGTTCIHGDITKILHNNRTHYFANISCF